MYATDVKRAGRAQPEAHGRIPQSSSWLAGTGVAVALAALAGSSCCVLPLLLAALGAGGAVFSGLEALVAYRPYLLGGAGLVLASGWIAFLRRPTAVCVSGGSCPPATRSPRIAIVLATGTLVTALATVWEPIVEPSS